MAYSEEYQQQLEQRQGSEPGNYGMNGTTSSSGVASESGNYGVGISGPVAGEAATPAPQAFTLSPLAIIAITVVVTLVIVASILLLTKKFRIVRAS